MGLGNRLPMAFMAWPRASCASCEMEPKDIAPVGKRVNMEERVLDGVSVWMRGC